MKKIFLAIFFVAAILGMASAQRGFGENELLFGAAVAQNIKNRKWWPIKDNPSDVDEIKIGFCIYNKLFGSFSWKNLIESLLADLFPITLAVLRVLGNPLSQLTPNGNSLFQLANDLLKTVWVPPPPRRVSPSVFCECFTANIPASKLYPKCLPCGHKDHPKVKSVS